ncbi:MAG: DeoR/GlpR family DNA-binding transcription regulator [Alicyclobacillus macrosporangiidus]|uniref:DeoR/GlpR family DNA-binding transcription regulator n=1 Tax=Alicyclobacillus macrosporangiidus TaxID=392015 RepID=UPI0026F0B20E|nr:DeoR/GlpR family DNA-binding transcription regulator [Alicyclobacillus macrosporangiidus]MCL6597206.1 DeoR/GlpR family DNA-binding transcription regulator [Alicyclobacillus macrosporangiidus]
MVTIKDVAARAGVSPATVSRVLNGVPTVDVEIAARVRQAASELDYHPNQAGRNLRMRIDSTFGPEFAVRSREHLAAKRKIAERAASFVSTNDTVGLDSGSTVSMMCPYLPSGVLIYTNSLAVLQPAARRGITVNLAPGRYVPEMAAVFGSDTDAYFRQRRLQRYFLSSAKVDVRRGLYNFNPLTTTVKLAAMERADMSILLVHHEKFCDADLDAYAPLTRVNLLITDYIPAPYRDVVLASGVPVIEVQPQAGDGA